ncbi:hypothetical protein ACFXD5_11345 [Streptomyces sp. NPDC059385]|uniref:hypothetical protein n=1 Tax=Streptomyces sp. NPDC059385 TaxID=3346817 RepID=UPI0036B4E099
MRAVREDAPRLRPQDRVHALQRALAAGALLAAALMSLFPLLLGAYDALHALTGACVAVPMLVRDRRHFAPTAAAIGLALLAWGAAGVFGLLIMWVYWPSAVLLVLAALGDPRRRPWAARVSGVAGALLVAAVAVLAGGATWAAYVNPLLTAPHAFQAETDPGWTNGTAFEDSVARLRRYGATNVYDVHSDGGSRLVVRFPDDLPEERRALLKEQMALIPGIHGVKPCSVRECG